MMPDDRTHNTNTQKRVMLELLMPLCPFVLVDSTQKGVVVPPALRNPELVLRIGRDPRVMGMPDLHLGQEGWSATLSIHGTHHHVVVPWEACGRFWIDEPFEGPLVLWFNAAELAERASRKKGKAAPKTAPKLRLVQDT